MKAVIDRFEGDLAVLTPAGGGAPFTVPLAELPAGARAGHSVELSGGCWLILLEESEARRRRIAEKARRLFGDE